MLAERGAALAGGPSDRAGWYARLLMADVALFQGRRDDAGRLFADVARDVRRAGDRWFSTVSLWTLALTRAYEGEMDSARDAAEQAPHEARALGNPMTAWVRDNKAEVLLDKDPTAPPGCWTRAPPWRARSGAAT